MTWDGFIAQQDKLMAEIERQGDIFGRAVSSVHSDIGVRVFSKGQSPQGDKIGSYSTKPISISADQSPKSFGSKKSKFFPGGYKEFRSFAGRESGFVNLGLFGQLQSDYLNGLRKVNASTWVAETKNPANDKKLEGARDKYGDVFELSAAEAKKLQEIWDKELQAYLNRTQ